MLEESPLPTLILTRMLSASKRANVTEPGRCCQGVRSSSVRTKSRSARACPNPWFGSSTKRQGNSDKPAVSLCVVSFLTACRAENGRHTEWWGTYGQKLDYEAMWPTRAGVTQLPPRRVVLRAVSLVQSTVGSERCKGVRVRR